MAYTLKYGDGETLRLDAPVAVAESAAEAAAVSDRGDPAELARRALETPLDYPPLSSCLAPGDHVALALAEGVPAAGGVVDGLLTALDSAGVAADRVVVLCEAKTDASRLEDELAAWRGRGVSVETHAPGDADQLCFAGLRHDDRELLLSRRLVEAEVAIPITRSRAIGGRTLGVFDGLYPAFADSDSRQNAPSDPSLEPAGRFSSAAEEAGWLLGVTLAVQVAPNIGGGVAAVFAGPAGAVSAAAARLTKALWTRRVAARAPLIIASVTGGGDQQTWANVARALRTAESVADPDAAIALCTTLGESLDDDLAARLASLDDEPWDATLSDERPESQAARQIAEARVRGPVYLLSRLDPDWVEEIGLAPVANERELSRLANSRQGGVVIEDAQHVSVELASAEAVL